MRLATPWAFFIANSSGHPGPQLDCNFVPRGRQTKKTRAEEYSNPTFKLPKCILRDTGLLLLFVPLSKKYYEK
jgi:hypothetical protein